MKLSTLKNNQVKVLAAATGFAVAALLAGPANAATDTTSFNVKIAIANSCDISTTAPADMDFGNQLASDTNITATTALTVTCTNGAPYNIGLTAASGAVGARKMTGATSSGTIAYQLYQDSGHATAWGDTIGTDTKTGTGSGAAQTVTVYGKVASASGAVSDSYSDKVTATITY